MSRIVDIENILEEYNNYKSFTGHLEYDEGHDSGVARMVDELEELPIEIDINRAKKAYERAQKRLESFKENPEVKSDVDTLRARAALERAKARLKATKTDIG